MDFGGLYGIFQKVTTSLLVVLVHCSICDAALTECKNDSSSVPPPTDWLENEVVSGFRVWQILFIIIGGIIIIVVALCCCMKCRIPRTRQEIEANYKRKQITIMFRSFLDKVPVEEIDLMWALETVKCLQLKENITKKKKKRQKKIKHVLRDDDSVFLDEESFSLDDEEDQNSTGFINKIVRILRRTKFKNDNNSSEESELPSEV